ncbi:MAG: 3-phosphoshikimate 1-carboxyvinyltransferase [Chloroflexi bacterium]|nr:3-phosphoshikimate 1-carboxyvinyltransferase [Chloroflexota bacterium]
MDRTVASPRRLQGSLVLPGDKSISHRAALFNAIAHGTATVRNYATGADCAATLSCLRALGVAVRRIEAGDGEGPGYAIAGGELHEPLDILSAANSGTTMRLLAGTLAGHPFLSILTGDRSLRSRPMGRVVAPLRLMGAQVQGRQGNTLAPLAIRGGGLKGIEYTMPVASAQLKSALLLAGLFAEGETVLHQPAASRDHTERMLEAMGASVRCDGLTVAVRAGQLRPVDVTVPADISSAAFWLVAAVCHPQARIRVLGVGVNPTRAGILTALRAMGARITLENQRVQGGEPVADLVAESSDLVATEVDGDLIPLLIDEVPVLALAACFARGTTTVRDASELRVKESDRLATITRELARLGADVTELPDGLVVRGTGRLAGATCRSHGDHRLAMMLGVAGLLASGQTTVQGAQVASVSYPAFWEHLASVAQGSAGAP